jgi:hypothetical protein
MSELIINLPTDTYPPTALEHKLSDQLFAPLPPSTTPSTFKQDFLRLGLIFLLFVASITGRDALSSVPVISGHPMLLVSLTALLFTFLFAVIEPRIKN